MNEPVLIVRPDDGPIGPKHVALNVLLMVTIDMLDGNTNTLYKIWNTSGQMKLSKQFSPFKPDTVHTSFLDSVKRTLNS